ncbi:MAG: serine/threonine-protein kinase [Candidatus Obscuribacterales bacterium]|nr:serine/threonine-protein kinase [Candidatus Obscuribacterales bacterium]
MQLRTGDLVKERYEIRKLLGEGGFATVYFAYDRELRRDVALKIPKDFGADSQKNLEDMKREARVLAQLLHPNIMRVYSVEIFDQQRLLIVMEYLEGRSLKELLSETGKGLESEILLPVFKRICSALAFAHAGGFVHRDLSPANVFLLGAAPDFEVKLIDFGLAKVFEPRIENAGQSSTMTATGVLVGNPAYMSPEACRGERVDRLGDIYALGCVLYEMLAGVPPFESWNAIGLLHLHQNEYPSVPKASWADPDSLSKIQNIALKCMQKEKSKRFQSVDQILQVLEGSSHAVNSLMAENLDCWLDAKPTGGTRKYLRSIQLGLLFTFSITAIVLVYWSFAMRVQPTSEIEKPADLKIPGGFKYEVDSLCRRLSASKGNESAAGLIEALTKIAGSLDYPRKASQLNYLLDQLAKQDFEKFPARNDTASSLTGLAMAYSVRGRFKDAERIAGFALRMCKESSIAVPAKLFCLVSVSEIYLQNGNSGRAESLLCEAVEVAKKVSGRDCLLWPTPFLSLAELRMSQGNYLAAESLCKEALKGKNNEEDSRRLLSYLAFLSARLKKYDDAENYYERAISISDEVFNVKLALLPYSRHLLRAGIGKIGDLICLGRIYEIRHKFSYAEKALLRALSMSDQLGKESVESGICLSELKDLYLKQDKIADADSCAKRLKGCRKGVPQHYFDRWLEFQADTDGFFRLKDRF